MCVYVFVCEQNIISIRISISLIMIVISITITIVIIIAYKYFNELVYFSALICLIGHIFPIWLKFKGGKGVATYVGILFSINLAIGFVFIGVWFFTFLISKYSSLSSLIATLSIPIYLFFFTNQSLVFFLIVFILILYTHRENIKRLKNKEESKTKIY